MKLRTETYAMTDGRDVLWDRESDVEHDALAAHALLRANREWWVESDENGIDEAQSPRDALRWIEQRADELMREWTGEVG